MSKRGTLRGRKGSWRNMQRLDDLFKKTGRQRGNLNEGIVKELLIELKKEEAIFGFEQNWDLDSIGIDFLVCLLDGELVAIQVKSSSRGVEKHHKKYGILIRFRNEDIRCLVLVVSPEHLVSRTELKEDIKNFIREGI